MAKTKKWPFPKYMRIRRFVGLNPDLTDILIGNAGNPELGEDVPIIIGEHLKLRERLRYDNYDVHSSYFEWLSTRKYKGEAYVVAKNYVPSEACRNKYPDERPAGAVPDGRTRHVIRDLKRFKEISTEKGREEIEKLARKNNY
ncbi:MAG: hypothetical protein HY741_11600 [Chloroflexi bacterium]|nr:hypothetical protein [Chloroflexota bacterium]